MKPLESIFVVLLALFCPSVLAGLIDEFQISKAKQICAEQKKFWAKESVKAEGYLFSSSETQAGGMELNSVARELLEKRFTFYEIPQRYSSSKLFTSAIGNGTRYFRFYLAPINSPACAGYLEEIQRYPSQKLPFLRGLGLPVDLCIASERTDESISRYEMRIDSDFQKNLTNAQGNRFYWSTKWSVRDKSNNEIVAEVSSNGYNPGPGWAGRNGFNCPNRDQVELFEKTAIQPIPDPRLPNPIRWSTVKPTPFSTTFELQAKVLSEQQSERFMSEYDYLSHLNPVADNGNLLLHDIYRLDVINPGIGIKANVQNAFDGVGWGGFQYLRFEKGEIIFLGIPNGSPLHSKEVAVFRYDRNANPLVAYRIRLPSITFKGDVRFLVENLSIGENAIELTLLDVTRGKNGNGMKVLTAYKLLAPIPNSSNRNH